MTSPLIAPLAALLLALPASSQHHVAWTTQPDAAVGFREHFRETSIRADGTSHLFLAEPTANFHIDAAIRVRAITRNGDIAWEGRWPIVGATVETVLSGSTVTTDGRSAFVLENRDVHSSVVVFEANGDLGWAHDLGTSSAGSLVVGRDVRGLADGGFVAVGSALGAGNVIRRLDAHGSVVWTTEFGDVAGEADTLMVRVAFDGSLRVLERSPNVNGSVRFLLHRISGAGSVEWTATQPFSEGKKAVMFDLDDAGVAYVVGGAVSGGSSPSRVWRTAPTGAPASNTALTYGPLAADLDSVTGEMVFAGARGIGVVGVTMLDAAGIVTVEETLPAILPQLVASDVAWTANGGVVVAAMWDTFASNNYSGPRGVVAIGLDAAGTLQWHEPFDEDVRSFNYVARVSAPSNGDVIVSFRRAIGASSSALPTAEVAVAARIVDGAVLGSSYCSSAASNSTGSPGRVTVIGSDAVSDDRVTLFFDSLPPNTVLLALTSRTQGLTVGAGNGQGDLCLGGAIGRFGRGGELRFVTPEGTSSLAISFGNLPSPTGIVTAMAGETWSFQGWFRDANPSTTHNFTDAVGVVLR